MMNSAGFALLLFFITAGSFALSPEKMQEYFEWGEYDRIIGELSHDSTFLPLDAKTSARYHMYLGVAYFSTGKIGEARIQFIDCFDLDSTVLLDRKYVTEEILDLFEDTRRVENERRFEVQRQRDSIAMIEQQRIQRNLKAIDEERNRRKRRTAFFSAGSCFTVSVLLAGMGMFQYVIAGQYYEHFKEAAAAGDLSKYNIYKQKTDKANMSVLSSGIISGLCFTAGCTISIKAFGKKKRS